MLLGVPKEIKNNEFRVGLTPASVKELVRQGHGVIVESNAGEGIGALNDDYTKAGAEIAEYADDVFARAEMIVKVKEPQLHECEKMREGQLLFTYLHLAADQKQTLALIESGVTAIAYETVEEAGGKLPLLAPMSEVAGRLSIQAGCHSLEKAQGGLGLLLGGVPGVTPAKVLIIGGGTVGYNAALMATGLGADVTIVDKSVARLRALSSEFGTRLKCVYATEDSVVDLALKSQLIVGAVLIPGAKAPKTLEKDHLKLMQKGSVVVDVAIDQGGCFDTSRPTTHDAPTYVEEGVVHYCVANMPGAVPHTSTYALNNVTLPYISLLAREGRVVLSGHVGLRSGVNVHHGKVTNLNVAEAFDMSFTDPVTALAG